MIKIKPIYQKPINYHFIRKNDTQIIIGILKTKKYYYINTQSIYCDNFLPKDEIVITDVINSYHNNEVLENKTLIQGDIVSIVTSELIELLKSFKSYSNRNKDNLLKLVNFYMSINNPINEEILIDIIRVVYPKLLDFKNRKIYNLKKQINEIKLLNHLNLLEV